MNKPLLKTAQLISAVAILFFISYSCSKQKLNSADEPQTTKNTRLTAAEDNASMREANSFKRTVGAPVDGKTGRQWIENFNKAGRNSGVSYIIQAKDLQTILSNPACAGICMYYALDAKKQIHILPIGVNESGMLMKSESVNTQRGMIDWETAQKWIANDPSDIDARFFGRNTFDRLLRDKSCQAIKATFASDDKRKPLLLLSNAAIENAKQISFEDMSAQCPPVCPIVAIQQQ